MEQASKLALFEQTMMPHLNAAYNLARWLTKNPDDAEDVVQEAYLRAYRFFDGFAGGDGRPWLLAVVRNTFFSGVKSGKDTRRVVPFDEKVHDRGLDEPDPEARMVSGGDVASLRDCVDALDSQYREVIVLRELEDMSYRDIAEAIAIPIGTVMSRLSRGRKLLAHCVRARAHGAAK